MKIDVLTHKDGRVYLLLHANCPMGGYITAESFCGKKDQIPAVVLPLSSAPDEYAIELPAVQTSQKVTVALCNARGEIIEELTHQVPYLLSTIDSKRNTLMNREKVFKLRLSENAPMKEVSRVDVDFLSGKGYEQADMDIVHARIMAYCPDETLTKAPYSISVFNKKGRQIAPSELLVLDDVCAKPVHTSPCRIRTISVSFKKPCAMDQFGIWFHFEDDALPQGFTYITAQETKRLYGEYESFQDRSYESEEYGRWFKSTQRASEIMAEALRAASFSIEPMFSIIVPIYKTPLNFFEEMVDSVVNQTYGKFELLLVNASPEDIPLKEAIRKRIISDCRIREIELEENLGITLNTNAGIRAAKGDFLCFFDHDDLLEPDLLYEYVRGINTYPDTDLLYCDEDMYNSGLYCMGVLKPDFNWTMLTSGNYLCHLLTVRKSIVDSFDELPGKEFDGSQDHNMALLVAEQARNIYHARKVLYHWRVHSKSTAGGNNKAKPWTLESGRIAVQNHFDRIGVRAIVRDAIEPNYYCTDYILPKNKPLVSIIIINEGNIQNLARCLTSLFEKTVYENFEVIVVESYEDKMSRVSQCNDSFDAARFLDFSGLPTKTKMLNFGASHAKGDYVAFLADHTEVTSSDWLEKLMGPLQVPGVSCSGAMIMYPDGTIQHAGIVLPQGDPVFMGQLLPDTSLDFYGYLIQARDSSAVSDVCMLVRKESFDAIHGFDESFIRAYEDVDFCLRLWQQGESVVFESAARINTHEPLPTVNGQYPTIKSSTSIIDNSTFRDKWVRYYIAGDPLYSNNFKPGSAYWELDWVTE